MKMRVKTTFFAKSLEKTFKIYYNVGVKNGKNEFLKIFSFKIIKNQQKETIMKSYSELSKSEQKKLYDELLSEYHEYKAKNLSLDLSRGKPNSDQLDISLPLLSESRPREKCFS